ncbi:hypothetical protein P872_21055 [Rhodonellum psychrophilum GCM71 = DSM 17998]|uniref:Uncharacterized protein n=2 Tax=Rhodonellum TaxID=336827 RepID=U5BSB0_9BACT|nr:hypothetical protein P872_21055 [Rhodonellum psychrophilum GCM71 = DSM 17998]SDZ44942.1 hypothetical protein SAMN05444412_11534 [Rhodonellum ikkaensis]
MLVFSKEKHKTLNLFVQGFMFSDPRPKSIQNRVFRFLGKEYLAIRINIKLRKEEID